MALISRKHIPARAPHQPHQRSRNYGCRSKTKGEARLDDNETRISGARRADVTGVGAWEPSCRGFGIGKILKKL
jgi:hypothetical protein